ncbi:GntR family transcriptional regulator [Primorskyibacter flagellatus]|nr:GntR family transcriptional regulator [Primorskyibacter flagellatus]
MDTLTPIEAESLTTAELSAAIRDYLLELPLQGGERIFESQLAKQINAGRQQVREACRMLESEGLLFYTPNRGYSMRVLTGAEVRQLLEFRCVIEGAAFASLADRADRNEALKVLRKAYVAIEESANIDDPAQQISADLSFHRIVVEMAGNNWLLQSFDRMSTQMRYAIRLMSRNLSDFKIYGKSHNALLGSIEEGDASKARAAIEEHILMFLPTLLQRIKD